MTTPRTRDPATPPGDRPADRAAGRRAAWALPRHPGDAVRLVIAAASWPSAPPWSKTVELLVGLATRFGPERAAAGARAELHARPDLRDLLARLVAPS
jgi:hypothetical protein